MIWRKKLMFDKKDEFFCLIWDNKRSKAPGVKMIIYHFLKNLNQTASLIILEKLINWISFSLFFWLQFNNLASAY